MIIATAGHVDHGKTRLVHALTGIDTDRLEEEKRRGLSIEPGFAYQRLADGSVLGFVDVPGHQRFVHNMLASIAGIDLALLVVAADDGPMPQTREHLAILGLLGVPRLIAVSSCVDRVDAARRRQALAGLRELLAGGPHADAPLLETSTASGEGVAELRDLLQTEALAHRRPPSRGCFRLAVDRRFSLPGAGVVVTGTVFAGSATAGDRLLLMPAARPVRLRGLHVADAAAERAYSGDRAALNLSAPGLETSDIQRGDWLVAPPIDHASERLDVRLHLLAGAPRNLRHWSEMRLHIGAAHLGVRVAVLGAGHIAPGDEAFAQLVATTPLHAVHGDRLVLRDPAARQTIAGGVVLDPLPPRRGRARPARLSCLQALSAQDKPQAVRELLEAAPHGVDSGWLARIFNLDQGERSVLLQEVPHVAPAAAASPLILAPRHWQNLLQQVLLAVGEHHRQQPRSLGPNISALARLLPGGPRPELAMAAATELVESGQLLRTGMLVHRPDHAVTLSEPEQQLWQRAAAALSPAEGSAPSLHALADSLQTPPDSLRELLELAVSAGLAAPVARNRYLPMTAVRSHARSIESLAAARMEAGFGVAEFRDEARVGRNFAIDLLEFFDRAGLTRRHGERRWLRTTAAALFGDEHACNR